MRVVSHYGLHWESDVAYVVQGRGSFNAIGSHVQAPFEVRLTDNTRHCNHQIPNASPVPHDYHWNFFVPLLGDALVRAALPIPKANDRWCFISDTDDRLLAALIMLSRMSSPIYRAVNPIQPNSADAIVAELRKTNVQPLILYNVEAQHSSVLNQVARTVESLPRTLILAGNEDVALPPVVKRITTDFNKGKYDLNDIMAFPWESIGSAVLRKYMRKDWPSAAELADGASPSSTSSKRQ